MVLGVGDCSVNDALANVGVSVQIPGLIDRYFPGVTPLKESEFYNMLFCTFSVPCADGFFNIKVFINVPSVV